MRAVRWRIRRPGRGGTPSLAVLLSLAWLAGCYTVEFHETTRPVALAACGAGPGGAEGELFDCVGLRRDAYSGEKIAIGLFPGQPYFTEGLNIGATAGTAVYAIWVPVGNLFFALPTVCTLLVEPFVQADPDRKVKDSDILAVGLAGAFRWKSTPHVETEEEYRERALLDGRYEADLARVPRTESADGTTVYLDYPGFRVLKGDVDAAGRVDVVFADGSRIRRFVLSERDENRLVYEDRDVAAEPAVGLRYGRYCEWRSLLLQTKRLRYEKGFGGADDALKGEISAFESDLLEAVGRAGDLAQDDRAACRERLRALRQRLGGPAAGR